MHELSVADAILERAFEAAAEHDAETIEELTIELGAATHVNPDQLTFCLEAVAEGSPAEDAAVTIETLEPRARCDCGWEGEPPQLDAAIPVAPDPRCPACGERTTLTRGKECRLSSVTVPDGDEADDPARDAAIENESDD